MSLSSERLYFLRLIKTLFTCLILLTWEVTSFDNESEMLSNATFHINSRKLLRSKMPSTRPCDKCLTRDQQVSQNYASFIPLFVKFHKVGSGTISDLMRRHCRQIGGRLNTESLIPWRGGKFCGMIPHTHSSLTM
jgi:hypothetical protein